jgi:hypothetical protein
MSNNTSINNPEIGKINIIVNEKDFSIICSDTLTMAEVFNILVTAVNELAQRDFDDDKHVH